MQLYRYFVSQYSEFSAITLCVYCYMDIFLYGVGPETFGYTVVYHNIWFVYRKC